MPSLLELPDELLLNIGLSFEKPTDISHQAALANLSLASRRLNNICQPILLTAPRLSLLRGVDPLRQWWQFARTILQAPVLAARVRALCLEAPGYVNDPESISKLRFDIDRCSAIKSVENEYLGSQIFVHRLAMLLIITLPNVNNLELHLPSCTNAVIMRLLWKDIYHANSQPPPLKRLNFEPRGSDDQNIAAVELEPAFFFNPSLKEIDVTALALWIDAEVRPLLQSQPITLGLVNLHLRKCFITPSTFTTWIKACTSLKAITFSSTYNDDFSGGQRLKPMQFLRALQSCTSTLERLDADFCDDRELVETYDGNTEAPQSDDIDEVTFQGFRAFKRLRHLRIEAARLQDVAVLPPCLETLTVFGDDLAAVTRRYHGEFGNLRRGQCPGLETVRLQYAGVGEAEMQSTLATLVWMNEETANVPELILDCEPP